MIQLAIQDDLNQYQFPRGKEAKLSFIIEMDVSCLFNSVDKLLVQRILQAVGGRKQMAF